MSADPYESPTAVREPQGWNRFAYVQGDPANYSDPGGTQRCPEGACADDTIRSGEFGFYMMQRIGVGGSSKPTQQEIEQRQTWEQNWRAADATTKTMREALSNKRDSLKGSNCMKVLGETYCNGLGEEESLTLAGVMPGGTYGPSVAYKTLRSVITDAMAIGGVAVTLGVAPSQANVSTVSGILPEVVLAGGQADASTLWGEFWHAGLGITEEGAVKKFGIQVNEGQSKSNAFHNWIEKGDCGAKEY